MHFVILLLFLGHQAYGFVAQVGYNPLSDTSEEYKLALDVGLISAYSKSSSAQYSLAYSVYTGGLNSLIPGTGVPRSLQSLSGSQSTGYPAAFRSFYQSNSFANEYISSAIQGTGMFENYSNTTNAREQGAWRGIQLLIIPSLVLDQLAVSVNSCRSNLSTAINEWDIAWAYFTGSGETIQGVGKMLYSIGRLRCFDSCFCEESSDSSPVISRILSAFRTGQISIANLDCNAAETQRIVIQRNFIILFAQGTVRGLYRNGVSNAPEVPAQRVEDYSYILGILPAVHECDPNLAVRLRNNLNFSSPINYMLEPYTLLLMDFVGIYGCLNILCTEVEGYCVPSNSGRRLQDNRLRRRLSSSSSGSYYTRLVPNGCPTPNPTGFPSKSPTLPTSNPTTKPTVSPTLPTLSPTRRPTSKSPTRSPTLPTLSPTTRPTTSPTLPTSSPTRRPTTGRPSRSPTSSRPSSTPTLSPTKSPTPPTTMNPTEQPSTTEPSLAPTLSSPSSAPYSSSPSLSPSISKPSSTPTHSPLTSTPFTNLPSMSPIVITPVPSVSPISSPSSSPIELVPQNAALVVGGAVGGSLAFIGMIILGLALVLRKQSPQETLALNQHSTI